MTPTTWAYNYRDQRWHEATIISRHAFNTVKVEWLAGPEHEKRDVLVSEAVVTADERPKGWPPSA